MFRAAHVAMICVFEERPQVFSNSPPPPPPLIKIFSRVNCFGGSFFGRNSGGKMLDHRHPHLDTNLRHCSNYCQEVAMETEILSLNSALACFCCLSQGTQEQLVFKNGEISHQCRSSSCFFSQAVWELIVSETNRYAEQSLSEKSTSHQSQWTPTTIPEMMAFVALLVCMGINRRPQYNMYWSKWDILHSAIYPATMSRNRFQAILNFFHLANNEEARKSKDSSPDKLVKVRKFIQMIVPSFLCHYKPGQNLSPDETMIKFKGRLLFKQYMPKKPTKWGIKCFSLNESDTGYTCAWQIYTGSQSQTATTADSERQSEADHPARVPLPGQVVLELLNGLDNRGHCIFADNWYTSPALVNKLTQRGFGFCGTVRYTTQGVSNFFPDNCVLPGRTRSV